MKKITDIRLENESLYIVSSRDDNTKFEGGLVRWHADDQTGLDITAHDVILEDMTFEMISETDSNTAYLRAESYNTLHRHVKLNSGNGGYGNVQGHDHTFIACVLSGLDDDGIAIKSVEGDTYNIQVIACTIEDAATFVAIGTQCYPNTKIYNVSIDGGFAIDVAKPIKIKPGKLNGGGIIENVRYSGLQIYGNIQDAINFDVQDNTTVRDVVIENININAQKSSIVKGDSSGIKITECNGTLENIQFRNINLRTVSGSPTVNNGFYFVGNITSAKNIKFENVVITGVNQNGIRDDGHNYLIEMDEITFEGNMENVLLLNGDYHFGRLIIKNNINYIHPSTDDINSYITTESYHQVYLDTLEKLDIGDYEIFTAPFKCWIVMVYGIVDVDIPISMLDWSNLSVRKKLPIGGDTILSIGSNFRGDEQAVTAYQPFRFMQYKNGNPRLIYKENTAVLNEGEQLIIRKSNTGQGQSFEYLVVRVDYVPFE